MEEKKKIQNIPHSKRTEEHTAQLKQILCVEIIHISFTTI